MIDSTDIYNKLHSNLLVSARSMNESVISTSSVVSSQNLWILFQSVESVRVWHSAAFVYVHLHRDNILRVSWKW